MSLRTDLIEAGSDAIDYSILSDPTTVAELVLDAMLGLLTERADEIAREAGDTFIDWQKVAPTDQWQRIVKNLTAVLRNPGSQP